VSKKCSGANPVPEAGKVSAKLEPFVQRSGRGAAICTAQEPLAATLLEGLGRGGQPKDQSMKQIILGAALAAVLATPLVAQTVVIAPEQRTAIKEYVVKEKIRPHKLQTRVTVGATLPADIELAPVPETWGPTFRSYRYIYTGDDVVLVDPGTRRVIQVID
jgi:hypothetical protein